MIFMLYNDEYEGYVDLDVVSMELYAKCIPVS